MKNYEFFPEQERWKSKLGWLESNFSFSFANYYNPNRMGFWTLRVINNDIVKAWTGFWMHPHDNMEIITIPLVWSLTHRDSMGHEKTIYPWEVQSMSAGSWIVHSEMNEWDIDGEFFQIWIETRKYDIEPQYGQKEFSEAWRIDNFQLLAGPNANGENVLINQDAYIYRANLWKWAILTYKKLNPENGIYIMNIFWNVQIGNFQLEYRDALGITNDDHIEIRASKASDIFVFEVPMKTESLF